MKRKRSLMLFYFVRTLKCFGDFAQKQKCTETTQFPFRCCGPFMSGCEGFPIRSERFLQRVLMSGESDWGRETWVVHSAHSTNRNAKLVRRVLSEAHAVKEPL